MVPGVTAPGPVFGAFDQSGTDGIQMDVATDLPVMALLLDEDGLVSALKEMADAMMAEVEVAGIATVEKLHSGGEVWFGGFDEQMIVIGHQGEGVDPPAIGIDGAGQPGQASGEVVVVLEEGSFFVSTRGYVVQRPGKFDSQWSGHEGIRPLGNQPVKRKNH